MPTPKTDSQKTKLHSTPMDKLKTSTAIRSFEALLEILVKLAGIVAVYLLFNWIGQTVFGSEFGQDTLLSLLLIPALYVLRDFLIIIEPFFVVVEKADTKVKVQYGLAPRVTDTLQLDSVDNVEVSKTPLGLVFNYGTIRLYGRGGQLEMPFVRDADKVAESINIG